MARLSGVIPDHLDVRIHTMAAHLGVSKLTVVRNALSLYLDVTKAQTEGAEVRVTIDRGGVVETVRIP